LFGHKKGAFTGALSDKVGYFEEANGGTLFLDEIQNASSEIQMKLLRAIDTGEYRRVGDDRDRRCDVRLIIASNEDLKQKVKEGKFREDLYYRISVIEIKIPPLRSARKYSAISVAIFGWRSQELKSPVECISPDAMLALIDYSWPGNVRQLKNSIINLLCRCDNNEIGPTEVLALLLSDNQYVPLKSLEEMVRGFKKECAIKALTLTNRNVTKAAELLKIDRATLYRLIEECGLKEFIKSQ
jgi:DNA-binding NtrC family response regulator